MDANLTLALMGLAFMVLGSLSLVQLSHEGKDRRPLGRAYTGEEEHHLDYLWMLEHGRKN